jgi:DNA-binding response OmpR family regulator
MMKKILVMDDDSAVRMLYSEELTDEGYDVITCSDPTELTDLIEQKGPDLLLMDTRLDGCSGLDLLQSIRDRYSEMPVILCTAYPAFKYDIKSVAADDYVVKSSNLQELKDKIRNVLYGDRTLQPENDVYPEKRINIEYQETFDWKNGG